MTIDDVFEAVMQLKGATELGFKRHDARFDGLEHRIRDVDVKVDHVERRMGRLETRIESIETNVGILRVDVGDIRLRLERVEARS